MKVSEERLKELEVEDDLYNYPPTQQELNGMAKELLALRKAFSEPAAYEVKGILCHTLEEAEIYVGEPEPLYRGPE